MKGFKYVLEKMCNGNWKVTKVPVVDFKAGDKVYLHGLEQQHLGMKVTLKKKGWFGGNKDPLVWDVINEDTNDEIKDVHIRDMHHVDEKMYEARWQGISDPKLKEDTRTWTCPNSKSQTAKVCSPGKCRKCDAVRHLQAFERVPRNERFFGGQYLINTYKEDDTSGIIVDDEKTFLNCDKQLRPKWRLKLSDVPREHALCPTCDCHLRG